MFPHLCGQLGIRNHRKRLPIDSVVLETLRPGPFMSRVLDKPIVYTRCLCDLFPLELKWLFLFCFLFYTFLFFPFSCLLPSFLPSSLLFSFTINNTSTQASLLLWWKALFSSRKFNSMLMSNFQFIEMILAFMRDRAIQYLRTFK